MWSDNETSVDLLGFQHLVDAVTSIVHSEHLLPTTIGVFGDWGSGKSSLIQMASEELAREPSALVLSFNGWLFEGFEDAKCALMGTILDGIEKHENLSKKARDLLASLARRVNWFRVIGTGIKYGGAYLLAGPAGLGIAATANSVAKVAETVREADVEDAAKFFREKGGEETRKAVREFRKDFESLLKETDIKTLVVVIDDLDRCMPDTVIETLEAIKLFLFVKRHSIHHRCRRATGEIRGSPTFPRIAWRACGGWARLSRKAHSVPDPCAPTSPNSSELPARNRVRWRRTRWLPGRPVECFEFLV